VSEGHAGERRVIASVADLHGFVGRELGASEWLAITQERVNAFADATGDQQYIHVDPARAQETFFGGTVAHGFLTLSLIPALFQQLQGIEVRLGGRLGVNYGLNKVRFPAPVRVGKRVRLRSTLLVVEEIGDQAVQLTHGHTIEIEGEARPACVAETVSRVYF